jgi:hypothetical protein
MGVGLIILNQKKYFAETKNVSEIEQSANNTNIHTDTKPDPDGETGQED